MPTVVGKIDDDFVAFDVLAVPSLAVELFYAICRLDSVCLVASYDAT